MTYNPLHRRCQGWIEPAHSHRPERDAVTLVAADCQELLTALRAIAEARTIPLAEIAPLHSEVSRLASIARREDPDFLRRWEAGRQVIATHAGTGEAVG